MKALTIKKVSEPSKGRGRRLISEQLQIEGNPPYVKKIKRR